MNSALRKNDRFSYELDFSVEYKYEMSVGQIARVTLVFMDVNTRKDSWNVARRQARSYNLWSWFNRG
jgi:hypothetical protein